MHYEKIVLFLLYNFLLGLQYYLLSLYHGYIYNIMYLPIYPSPDNRALHTLIPSFTNKIFLGFSKNFRILIHQIKF